MADVVTTLSDYDTSSCASEPIHIPGGVQPHGVLLSVDAELRVLQMSENVGCIARPEVDELLGKPLGIVIGIEGEKLVRSVIARRLPESMPVYAGSIEVSVDSGGSVGPFAVVVHCHANAIIVELEPAQGTADVFASMYPLVRSFVNDLQQQQTVEKLAQLAADEVKRITGFGRTLVYRFDDQGHGHVLAEAIDEGYPSYLGQRFPGSDIPAQARELYRLNRIRLIADANYRPAKLVPEKHPQTGKLTDLTFASLRSVSPVHVQYMKNMGTMSSMSMSIIVDDKLWGLISCHHAQPRLPHFEVRTACEHIAQILSLQIEAKEAQAESSQRLHLRSLLTRLLATMADRDSFVDGLVEDAGDLLNFTSSSGCAIVFEGTTRLVGATPDEAQVNQLVSWLDTQTDDIFATDNLATECDAIRSTEDYAGFLAVSISKVFRNYVIWFRREVVRTIDWAGDPRIKLASLPSTLSPRESFETWTETVRGRTLPWQRAELEIALEFRTAVLGIVLRRAEELAQLALELGRANRELENFSYSVSHDLRAPLRHIAGFADLVVETTGEQLPDSARRYIEKIRASARFGGQLVDDLLALAQMGRAALRPQSFDLAPVAWKVIAQTTADTEERTVSWEIDDLMPVAADPIFIESALRNLIDNAIKFSRSRDQPVIKIRSYAGSGPLSGQTVYQVEDNGVGFDMKYVDKLFGVFQRLHADEEFGGTGMGLATVRRIVERHGGQVWAEGRVDQGATISFSLPRQFRPESGARAETAASAFARLSATSSGAIVQGIRKSLKES